MAKVPNKKRGRQPAAEKEFDQRVIDLARVTRVMAGGKRMRFRACVAIGDKKGRCGIGLAKGADVTMAINKAVNRAQKRLITVPIVNSTIPHRLYIKKGAAKILLKPAPVGTGVKAGGAVRLVLELAGVPNVSAKMLGTSNKINNVDALIDGLCSFKVNTKPAKKKQSAKKDQAGETAAPVAEVKAEAVEEKKSDDSVEPQIDQSADKQD